MSQLKLKKGSTTDICNLVRKTDYNTKISENDVAKKTEYNGLVKKLKILVLLILVIQLEKLIITQK